MVLRTDSASRIALVALALALAAAPASRALDTYPPAPGRAPSPQEAEGRAREALFGGRPEAALRILLAAGPEGQSEPSRLRLSAMAYLALERPMRALEELARGGREEKAMAALLLARQAPEATPAAFRPSGQSWPGLAREALRDARKVFPAEDGTLWLMGKDRLWQVSGEGRTLLTVSLAGAQDLCADGGGGPLALGSKQVFWRGQNLLLPPDLARPISAAETPDGRLLILDGKGAALVRLNSDGRVDRRSVFPLDDPVRVRADAAGRVYILDGATRCVYIYSAGLDPLRILDPEARGYPLRKASDLFVDFAGDMLLLDGRDDAAALFSAQGRFLGASRPEEVRMDAVGWDGASSLLHLDRREGRVGRIAP